ncbi:hypothetical protein VSR83_36760 [Paraburkholderia unamae]|uniref:Uncharacterized protein n=1 Tax=Paraburkholderia unamae TaxID=219649 RepID=A0ACC6RV47_9BURK
MLSPHEFATLMLVRQAPDQLDMNRAELDALLERQLVMLEHGSAGRRRAHLTERGRTILDVLHPDSVERRRRGRGFQASVRRDGFRNAARRRLNTGVPNDDCRNGSCAYQVQGTSHGTAIDQGKARCVACIAQGVAIRRTVGFQAIVSFCFNYRLTCQLRTQRNPA